MFEIYLCNKFHSLSSNGWSVVTVKLEAKLTFLRDYCTVRMVSTGMMFTFSLVKIDHLLQVLKEGGCAHAHTHSHLFSLLLTHTHTHILSHSHMHTHTHTHTHTLTHTHSLSYSHSLTHTHPHPHTHLSHSLHSISYSLSLTHTHTFSCARAHLH
jgi:hypothetical protein